jgi:hypothetical protein
MIAEQQAGRARGEKYANYIDMANWLTAWRSDLKPTLGLDLGINVFAAGSGGSMVEPLECLQAAPVPASPLPALSEPQGQGLEKQEEGHRASGQYASHGGPDALRLVSPAHEFSGSGAPGDRARRPQGCKHEPVRPRNG